MLLIQHGLQARFALARARIQYIYTRICERDLKTTVRYIIQITRPTTVLTFRADLARGVPKTCAQFWHGVQDVTTALGGGDPGRAPDAL